MRIVPLSGAHEAELFARTVETWDGEVIAAHDRLYNLRDLPCLTAIDADELLGYCFYESVGDTCEIIALETIRQGIGIGGALIEEVKALAIAERRARLCVTTTNDNVYAIGYYQRRGFSIKSIDICAVNRARKLKPSIPLAGEGGVPLEHEINFEISL